MINVTRSRAPLQVRTKVEVSSSTNVLFWSCVQPGDMVMRIAGMAIVLPHFDIAVSPEHEADQRNLALRYPVRRSYVCAWIGLTIRRQPAL
jgi:hypothetical protein